MTDTDTLGGPALRSGALLGGWRLGRKLGEGSDGLIFAARRDAVAAAGAGIERAILKIPRDAAGRAALENEAAALAAVRHPGVIASRGLESEAGRTWLVLAHEEGETLAERLGRGEGYDEKALLSILRGLAEALEAIHAAGWLHRDLKPANVLIRSDGGPLLLDLGAAAPRQDGSDRQPPADRASAGYAAPELYDEAGEEGPRSDLYALAAVAYRIVCGRAPLPAPERLERGSARRSLPDRSDAAATLGVDRWRPALLEEIDRALSLDPKTRPKSPAAWISSLEAALAKAPPLAPAEPSPSAGPADTAEAKSEAPAGFADPADDLPPTERIDRRRLSVTFEEMAARRRAEFRKPPGKSRFGALGIALVGCLLAAIGFGGWEAWLRYVKTDWVIDPEGGGDATSVREALIRAKEGAILHLEPGLYQEALLLDRPLTLEGPDAPGRHARFETQEGPCALAVSEGVTLRRLDFARGPLPEGAAAPAAACLDIRTSAILEDVTVSDSQGTALRVSGGADPALTRLTVTAPAGSGLIFEEAAEGTLSASRIAGTGAAGIILRGGAEPAILDSVVEASGAAGILATGEAGGLIRNNDIQDAAGSAIEIREGAEPQVLENRLQGSAGAGLYVYEGGRGLIEKNRIAGNALSGVLVGPGGAPALRENQIESNGQHGLVFLAGAGGRAEANVIADNTGHGLVVSDAAEVEIGENRLTGNREPQTLTARVEAEEARPVAGEAAE